MTANGGDPGWGARAACRGKARDDRWFADTDEVRAVARHICVEHCPVLRECWEYVLRERDRGHPPVACVAGGLNWNDKGKATRREQVIATRCDRCWSPPEVAAPDKDQVVRDTLLLADCGFTRIQIARLMNVPLRVVTARLTYGRAAVQAGRL